MDRLIQELPSFLSIWNIIFLLKAMGVTFLLSLIGCLVGFSLGTLLAIFRKTKSTLLIPLRILIVIYTEIFRRIPFLVSLLLIFYIFQIVKITDSLFIIAIVTVCLIAPKPSLTFSFPRTSPRARCASADFGLIRIASSK